MHLQLQARHSQRSTKSNSKTTTRLSGLTKTVTIIATSLLTMSCANSISQPQPQVYNRGGYNTAQPRPVPATAQQAPQIIRQAPIAVERNINIERAQHYQSLAATSNVQTRINSQLNAAENYIQAQDFYNAERQSSGLQTLTLNKTQADRLTIINAYIEYQRKNYSNALQTLAPITQGLLPKPVIVNTEGVNNEEPIAQNTPNAAPTQRLTIQQVDALLLSSFCYQKLGDYDTAIATLLRRESALVGNARTETTRYIWQVIDTIPSRQRQLIIANTNYPLVGNRLEQSLQGQITQSNIAPSQFTQWKDEPTSKKVNAVNSNWGESSPRNIAVLLPLTSKFNKAAQALMDGIKYQNSLNDSQYRPQIQVYDIGQNSIQASQFYAAAIKAGADFVIGPLGKEYADQIASRNNNRVPTILLGGDYSASGSTLRFSMSPEAEGIRVAERAQKDGHLNAAILAPNTALNQRIISAFSDKWLRTGGKISSVINYDKTQYDHSPQLKQLFDIGSSESRYTTISNTLGFKPKFNAAQRKDLDFILMLADNESGRIVRPQINFFSGSKIPVYSTSHIFNGIPNTIDNIDLDNTIFPIMPWVFQSRESASYAGQLNHLFAMGADAYEIAGNYQNLRSNPDAALNANTGRINITKNSNIISQPLWAKFVKGEASLVDKLDFKLTPIESSNGYSNGSSSPQNQSNGKGVYNDKTWDSGESRRKTGP